jgi:hypothetical protein
VRWLFPIGSSLYYLSSFRIYFMLFIREWNLKLFPSNLKIILNKEKKYLLALKRFSFEEYQWLRTSVLIPHIMLSNMLEKNAIKCSIMTTILRYRGFLDSMFFIMEAIWSMNFKNLKILRVFFIVVRRRYATKAAVF